MLHKCGCCGERYKEAHRLFCSNCLEKYKGHPTIFENVKACEICGKLFCPTQPKKKFCSDECAEEAYRKRAHLRTEEKQKQRSAEKKEEKKVKKILKDTWWGKYEAADKLSKYCMLARRQGMTYGQFMGLVSEGKISKTQLEMNYKHIEFAKAEKQAKRKESKDV